MDITVTQFSEHTGISKTNVNCFLSLMVELGVITVVGKARKPGSRGKPNKVYRVTPKNLKEMAKKLTELLAGYEADWSALHTVIDGNVVSNPTPPAPEVTETEESEDTDTAKVA